MSATHDKSQKITFVYSNLYHLYKKGKEAAQKASASGNVLKADDLHNPKFVAQKNISKHQPVELLGKRVERPAILPPKNPAIDSLKQNLKTLNDLHSRLRFMLQELEDLVRE